MLNMHLRFSQQQQTPQPPPAPPGWRSPHFQPVPDSTPWQPLSNLIPWPSGSTSQIFRTVIKLPQLMQMYLGAELDIDAPDVESVFARSPFVWERPAKIDSAVSRKEETVLFDPKDEDSGEGANGDERSVKDARSSTPASNEPSPSPI
ncbi:hypothetical protein FRC04_009467 [Tulasnella sp. 424]|nr:hypothetical protein FRC04_009467 [Tulasnella sp. 424]